MDDAEVVRRLERVGDLPCDRQSLCHRNRPAPDDRGQVFAFDQLHHERANAAARSLRFFEAVDLRDVGMVQRRQRLRFTTETRQPVGIVREQRRQHLDRDVAIEACIAGAKHFAHPARTKRADDLVRAEPTALRE